MKHPITFILLYQLFASYVNAQTIRTEMLFDDDWKFFRGDTIGAELPTFDDRTWRAIDLPHDWTIENLPNPIPGKIIGPFSKESPGTTATAYTIGGTGWYRKTFSLNDADKYSQSVLNFDGVYMDCDVWLNGKLLGTHPYGYTAFDIDISEALKPAGQSNVIAVKVRNEGKNSRWYSGSGIYRHVWLIQKQAIHIAQNGISITTKNLTPEKATLNLAVLVENTSGKETDVKLIIRLKSPDGKVSQPTETPVIKIQASQEIKQNIVVPQPNPWSLEKPDLYTAEIQVETKGRVTDKTSTIFGIRTIHFDAQTGFTLNGKSVLLKGGCLHHDNGFLGSAAIDRAEERRVQLMKMNGFNAIRTAHNPPSKQFLDACDRIGIVVIDEAFDMWERQKNPQDYHRFFNEWWQRDLQSMILRDRNHPSVILWSIGNEINERVDSLGLVIAKKLVAEAKRLDSTRPVTNALCSFYDHRGYTWDMTIPAFELLDVGSYNYMWKEYESDHKMFPDRIMIGTESYAKEAFTNWNLVEKNSYIIGDFVWTAMDHLGETGLGNSRIDSIGKKSRGGLLQPFPWFNAFAGDIDLIGEKKPQHYYRDVIWKTEDLQILVHTPVPAGMKEITSDWGWPDEIPSWSWQGHEGEMMDIRVFTNYPVIRLELNGKIVAEKEIQAEDKLIANFTVPYTPGILKAMAMKDGKEVAYKQLITTGVPAKIKLTADRNKIRADRNDLSYVKIEITDALGNVVPDATIPVTLKVSGDGEIAGSGNACPYDMESFNNPVCKTYRGQALAILRPLRNKKSGSIALQAEAKGLTKETLNVSFQ
jgi:beta-galactosidase